MYPSYTLEVLWEGEWRTLGRASTPRSHQRMSEHMAALAVSPKRPAKAEQYRIVQDSIYAGHAGTVVEVAA